MTCTDVERAVARAPVDAPDRTAPQSAPRLAIRRGGSGPILGIALLALWLVGLGRYPLFDIDEGSFAQASIEMLVSGDWLHTTLNGIDRFDKPILIYWLQAVALASLGQHEFAARMPSALAGWAWCLATWHFVAQRWGSAAGMLSAITLATSLGPTIIGRVATVDALLNLLLALTMFDLWRHLEYASNDDGAARTALRRAYLWAALGVLAKGPVAVVVPAGAAFAWLLLTRGRAWPKLVCVLTDAPAWLVFIMIALPWYAYAIHRHGDAFVQGFFIRHNLVRFTGPLEGHSGSALYYLLTLPLLMMPWTPLLIPLLYSLRQHLRHPLCGFLLAWAGFVLLFFSLSGTKLPHYGLYGYTPLAILAARCLGRRPSAGVIAAVLACCALEVCLGAAGPQLAAALAKRAADPFWSDLLAPATLPSAPSLVGAGLVSWVCLLVAGCLIRARPPQGPLVLSAAAIATTCWLTARGIPWWADALQGPVKTLAHEARDRGAPLVQWHAHQPSAGFYAGAPAPRRPPAPGEAALVRIDRLPEALRESQTPLELLARLPGYALLGAQPHSP